MKDKECFSKEDAEALLIKAFRYHTAETLHKWLNGKVYAFMNNQVFIEGKPFDFNSPQFQKEVNKVKADIKKMKDNAKIDVSKLGNKFTI